MCSCCCNRWNLAFRLSCRRKMMTFVHVITWTRSRTFSLLRWLLLRWRWMKYPLTESLGELLQERCSTTENPLQTGVLGQCWSGPTPHLFRHLSPSQIYQPSRNNSFVEARQAKLFFTGKQSAKCYRAVVAGLLAASS